MCNLNSKGESTIKLLNLDLFYKEVRCFCDQNLSNSSLKFTYEWRQQLWRHNLTFGVILLAILIGLVIRISRPSLVWKELKQAKLF